MEDELTYRAATFLSGGLVATGETCGAIIGGLMAIGMKYGRSNPLEGTELNRAGPAYKLLAWFKRTYGTLKCLELTRLSKGVLWLTEEEKKTWRKSKEHQQCFRRCGDVAARVAEIVIEQGDAVVSGAEAIEEEKRQSQA